MNFYSEFGEDRWIADNLPLPATGYYVDVGCAHPTEGSNTAFLRARGWRGLAIDANPGWGAVWQTAAPDHFVQAFVSDKRIVSFEFKEAHYESRITPGNTRYAAVPLWTLVDHDYDIDLLTLDVEGHEFEVLTTLDNWRIPQLPPIIVSEYNTRGIGEDMRVRDYLLARGYRLVHTTVANHIFHRA
ncbi:MAG: FkbM family methyltransferase [Verrucomicrobiota bacterium]